jgi:hypothetical protein
MPIVLHGYGTSLDSLGSKDFLPRWMEKGPKRQFKFHLVWNFIGYLRWNRKGGKQDELEFGFLFHAFNVDSLT